MQSAGSAARAFPSSAVAAAHGRAASTVSAGAGAATPPPRGLGYQPELAHAMARARQARPKASELAGNPALRAEGPGHAGPPGLAPEQASGRLKVKYPGDPVHAGQPRDHLPVRLRLPPRRPAAELKACLRAGRGARRGPGPAGADQIIGAVPIGQRPPEGEAARARPPRRRPDHGLEGVQLRRRHHRRAHHRLPHPGPAPPGHTANTVAPSPSAWRPAPWFAAHPDLGQRLGNGPARSASPPKPGSGIADPYAPWQRGTNENTTGCSANTSPRAPTSAPPHPAQLQAIDAELDDRPRKRLGYPPPPKNSLSSSNKIKSKSRCDDP